MEWIDTKANTDPPLAISDQVDRKVAGNQVLANEFRMLISITWENGGEVIFDERHINQSFVLQTMIANLVLEEDKPYEVPPEFSSRIYQQIKIYCERLEIRDQGIFANDAINAEDMVEFAALLKVRFIPKYRGE